MYGARVTMRDGRVYENMDLRGGNNAAKSGFNLMFTARDNPMAWLELNFNNIQTIDKTPPLADQEPPAAIPGESHNRNYLVQHPGAVTDYFKGDGQPAN